METPRIFISYSWTNPQHEEWVIDLAKRLTASGIHVSIDKWDLKEGHDKYSFMESMVNSPDIKKVLILLDKKYTIRANDRTGGVGTETQIISPEIYNNVSQEKFIPIICEKDENGNAYIPTFLKNVIYIDLSEQERFEAEYERLERNIFNRPEYSRPKLGKAPDYLFDEINNNSNTNILIKTFQSNVEKNPKRVNSLVKDFLDNFYTNLLEFKIDFGTNVIENIGKMICDNINAYTGLRNDFILFFDKLLSLQIEYDIDIVIKFLERLPLLTTPQGNPSGGWKSYEYDNFRFFIKELFLYLITVGLKNESYSFVEELLYSSYFLQDKYERFDTPQRFDKFWHRVDVIDKYYNGVSSTKYHSASADLMIKRIPENFVIQQLVDADLLCHYIADYQGLHWFPNTYVYRDNQKNQLFHRLSSLRHFNKVKRLFAVETVQELKEKLNAIKEKPIDQYRISYSNSHSYVSPIYQAIDIEKLGTER